MRAKRARKFLGHAHFIKTTPILLPSRAAACLQTAPQTVWRVVFRTGLELGHYYHQPLSYMYVNHCISMAKHISSTAFYIATLTIWGGGVATPETPPLDPPLIWLMYKLIKPI